MFNFYLLQWVGETCADVAKMTPTLDDDLKEGWQQRAIERRAKKMANQLAEDLFKERSAQVEQRARDIVASGTKACECESKPRDEPKADDPSCSLASPEGKPSKCFQLDFPRKHKYMLYVCVILRKLH